MAVSTTTVLDVPSLVSQLMSIERQPIDKLEAKMDSHRGETLNSFERVFERLDNIADRLPPK
jgi:flagellar capping protein FliD